MTKTVSGESIVVIVPESLNMQFRNEYYREIGYRENQTLVRHDSKGSPSYFTIDGPKGSRPFKFSVDFYQTV